MNQSNEAKRWLVVCAVGLLTACGAQVPPAPTVTYWKDVAPILNEACVKCHQAGGIAPIQLDSYAAVKANAAAIAAATSAGTMPPFLVTHDGSCGTFDDHETLTAAQISTLEVWAKSTQVEGTPVTLDKPAIASLASGEDYQTPALVPVAQGGVLAQDDEYRCYPLGNATGLDRFITGYDVTPGNKAIVHHVLGFVVDPTHVTRSGQTNAQVMSALDAQDPARVGWPCFGLAGDGVEVDSVPVSWAPGQGPTLYPTGIGYQLPGNAVFVVQVHYNLAAVTGQSDSSRVRLRTAATVERRALSLLWDPLLDTLGGTPTALPPATPSTQVKFSATGAEAGFGQLPYVDLIGVMPHMHGRGRQIELRVGTTTTAAACASRIDQWNFDWQKFYFYAGTPLRLTGQSTFEVTCTYDTSAETSPVYPGWGTRNEMCLNILMLALPPGL